MIEIWKKVANFNATKQILAGQSTMILKKCSFSDFEIMEICRLVNDEKYDQQE